MDIRTASDHLTSNYSKIGLECESDDAEGFKLVHHDSGHEILLSIAEITEYVECSKLFDQFKTIPVECALCSPNYREHMLFQPRGRFPRRRLSEVVFGDPKGSSLFVEIGPASLPFINYFRFSDYFVQGFIENMVYVIEEGEAIQEVRRLIHRPLTLKIHNLKKASAEEALNHSIELADACLFNLGYLLNLPLQLAEGWPRRQSPPLSFRVAAAPEEKQFDLPSIRYNQDTLRFYQRALGTDDPVNRFLSFYQILEYYFVLASDESLYAKISRRINDPRFATSPPNLDRIIQDTLEHRRETDETEMLRLVLNKFLDENDIIEFITKYEEHLKEKFFSAKHNMFGEQIEVRLATGHVVHNLAKRIKVIRNALVHSSDRYERQARYIPTAAAEEQLAREVPLLQFLAEKVIIASAAERAAQSNFT